MGLDADALRFLIDCHKTGVDFSKTLTIGRQLLGVNDASHFDSILKGFKGDGHRLLTRDGGMADSFLRLLGCENPESLDASSYEGATILHDLNLPLPRSLSERFTAVIDSGSLEHVFNFPQALKSCMKMVSKGGHLLIVTPANNFFGHGFYQFSPEVFYRALTEENGYEIETVKAFVGNGPSKDVPDSLAVRKRVMLMNSQWTYLLVRAKRTEIRPIFEIWPQQSDYLDAWKGDLWHVDSEWLSLK